jgi:hypothetical protein
MSDALQAEDFHLFATADLTGIEFWNPEASDADCLGSVFWEILNNSGTLPGATRNCVGNGNPYANGRRDGTRF